ncbi:hypothetical protein D3C87_1837930 [compost metagenome]
MGTQIEVQIVQGQGAVVDHDLIDHSLLMYLAIIAAEVGNQLTVALLYGVDPIRHSEGHRQVLQAAHVRHQVHRHHLRRKRPVRCDDLQFCTAVGNDLGSL